MATPPKSIRLVLTAEQTAAIADDGPRFSFVMVSPGSWPTDPGRMVLHLIETDSQTANAAVGVLQGTHRAVAVKPKPSKP